MSELVIKNRFVVRLAHLPSYIRFGMAVLVSLIAWFILPHAWTQQIRLVATWDTFALSALSFIWYTMLSLEPTHIRRVARIEDPSRALSSVLVVLGAAASLLAVFVLLQSSMTMQSGDKTQAIILALSAVVLAWALIHTVFTLRYAHIYHSTEDGAEGLDFPGDNPCPEYLDFAYFAFVIGMTAQTSDVAISSRRLRNNVLAHGIISFSFNTAVVALSISVLTTLF
ncbi:MAG: DUF1345 domain-containing protein [Gemmatimonadaceae bacterium]